MQTHQQKLKIQMHMLYLSNKKTLKQQNQNPFKKNMLSYLLLLLCLTTTTTANELTALRRLSAAVGGRTLLWNFSSSTACSFTGIICDSASGTLTEIRLPAAGLSGQIPAATIGNLTGLRRLSLRGNFLSGKIPSDLPLSLESLFLQENNFSGEIPTTLFSLSSLKRLVLSGNRLSGGLSPELNRLGQLRTLNLEKNDLTGSIPQLDNLTNIQIFNISYNNLTGPVPKTLSKFSSDSFINTSMCGSPLSACESNRENRDSLSAGAIAGIVTGSVVGLVVILVVIFMLWRRYMYNISARTQPRADTSPSITTTPELVLEKKNSKSSESGVSNGNDGMVFFERGFGFGLEDLLRASAEVLGKGTAGSSYRAYLEGGTEVVVKRLKNVCVVEREFRERLEVFGRVRHENLVGVKGYYFGKEEKLVVYESLPLGSLASLLHGYKGADMAPLTWEARAKIAYEAARGICYLHTVGPNISHGNIKSSNILLTDLYIARVSEFCINQLVSNTSTLNRNGYLAPEVTDTRTVSHKADVYSYGIVLLELVTGKDPEKGGLDLSRWVLSAVKEQAASVFDDELVRYENEKTEEMIKVLQLGIECSSVHPDKRPLMIKVASRLEELCSRR